jgi:hypothetical protein
MTKYRDVLVYDQVDLLLNCIMKVVRFSLSGFFCLVSNFDLLIY